MNYKLEKREFYSNGLVCFEKYANKETTGEVVKIWNSRGKLKNIIHGYQIFIEGEQLELMYWIKKK